MRTKFYYYVITLSLLLLISNINNCLGLTHDQILSKVDVSLQSLPEKIATLKAEIKRVALYNIRTDKNDLSLSLSKIIEGKIVTAFSKLSRPILIYSPEIKPMRIIAKENVLNFTSGFQSTDEIKDTGRKLRVDGLLEGDVCITEAETYLTLRIIDTDSLNMVWSDYFDSIISTSVAKPSTTGIDFGFSFGGMQISETSSSGQITVPPFVNYFSFDLRILQKTILNDKAKLTFTGGGMYLYNGIESSLVETTMVSSAKKNIGSISPYGRIGIKIPLVPVATKPGAPKRDWLATEISVGKILGWDIEEITMFDTIGLKLETDIAENTSISIGISYVSLYEMTLKAAPNEIKVRSGGLYYEISILRFNFAP